MGRGRASRPRASVRHGGRAAYRHVNGDRYGDVVVERRNLTMAIALWLLSCLAALVWHTLRYPLVPALLALLLASLNVLGSYGTAVLLAVLTAAVAVWRGRWPESCERVLVRRVRARWRGWWVYRRRWQPAMTLTGLAVVFGEAQYLPRIAHVRSDRWGDHLLVRLLSGQCPEHLEKVTGELAHTFGAQACRVRVERPGRVWLDFQVRDPLAQVVDALTVPDVPDLTALPLGVREDGAPWVLRLLGSHVLVAGATGAGKGSVLWSLLRSVGVGLREGSVQAWVVDPKGGMELSAGLPVFTRFACTDPLETAQLLEDAVALLQDRAQRLRGVTRQHVPSPDDPLVLVVVDEIAALTAYLPDRDAKRRIAQALGVLLSQGRAVGVLVVAAVQDPRKDALPFRDLFPTRIALRLTEADQVDLVLGDGARSRGAECDRIPVSQPGVGYVLLDGRREPVRVRAAYVPDDGPGSIAELVAGYPSPTGPTSDTSLAAVLDEWAA